MSDRDKFAMAALTGLLTQRATSIESPRPELAAQVAYKYADAMLKEQKAVSGIDTPLVESMVTMIMKQGYDFSQRGITLDSESGIKTIEHTVKNIEHLLNVIIENQRQQ